MSILIKGMKMPQSCYMCDMLELSGAVVCKHAYDTKNIDWGRALNCPLIELPDHGDLIDREYAVGSACSGIKRTLPTTEDGEDWIRVEEVRQSLKSVPAVIPAERSEK